MREPWKPWGCWTDRQKCLLTTDGPGLRTKVSALREELRLHFLRGMAVGVAAMWAIHLLKHLF